MNKLFKTSIYSVSFLFVLFSVSCEKDNFPSSPVINDERIDSNDYNDIAYTHCSIILDSIRTFQSTCGRNGFDQITYPYKIVRWFGKLKNASNITINRGAVAFLANVYTDSTKKVIITQSTASFELLKLEPGESHIIEIDSYCQAVDTTKYPDFYPDSILFMNMN